MKARRQPKPAATPAKPAPLRVRMYRQGLGDCFLLTFNPGKNEAHMLIDCGTLGATGKKVPLKKVVEHIGATTKNHLHLLVATHEHQDHVRGFRECLEEFTKEKGIRVDHVWLAWTEDPRDEMAQKLAIYKEDLGRALTSAARLLQEAPADPLANRLGAAAVDVLGFFDSAEGLGADHFAPTVHEAMEFVRTGMGCDPLYLKPGDGPFAEGWMAGFRIYVLGPPRSESALKNLGAHGSGELYRFAPGIVSALTLRGMDSASGPFSKPDVQLAPAAEEAFESEMPFDIQYRNRLPNDLLVEDPLARYLEEKWRRIDYDWLYGTADLALQLDSITNNTSLALAIERISDGKVLLFPADAQQGNWLSWHDLPLRWTVKANSGGVRPVNAAGLLERTVFYKVGHHGSHNATAKGQGLELMGHHGELTAFIPVDRAIALNRNPKESWQMPARALYKRLLEKCEGRVCRSDLGWADDARQGPESEKEFEQIAPVNQWKEWKTAQAKAEAEHRVEVEELYIDYFLR